MSNSTRIKRFVVPASVRFVVNDDGAVLMDINSGSIYSLNVVAGFIWNQLTAGRTREEIADALALKCHISKELGLADVENFTIELVRNKLLKVDSTS